MDAFFDTISSYPTSVYTVILGVMLVFWIFAILGMLDIDLIPTDVDEGIFEADVNFDGEIPGFVGLLHTLGLTGVPFTLVISIIALIGFTLCYVVSAYLLMPLGSSLIRYAAGTLVLVAGLALSIPITAKLIKPMKPLFVKHFAPSNRDFIGHPCTVSSSRVSDTFGIGIVETGGSPLQINIRADDKQGFKKGMTVRIADYHEANDVFDVISEEAYQKLIG
ncbi:MAG: ubiquinone biosynthesis protein [Candidatus Thiodiazotropha sp. (ex Dulcina madagascariensis)]|nr:ubiquinone biosynthesis protein [Candidatus Thiodiazotropha sp. (ex Dulcina madagascariensis)]